MAHRNRIMLWIPRGLVTLVAALGLTMLPSQASAEVTCPTTSSDDFDGDGFTDAQECAGITTLGTTAGDGTVVGQRSFPLCLTGMNRQSCVDPNSKDVFVIYVPAVSGSLLSGSVATAIADPFANQTAYGLAFTGFSGIALTGHVLDSTQASMATRQVTSVSQQKAVVIVEDLDATDLNTLAYCPYGRPNVATQDCVVFTQRIVDTIALICGTLPIVTNAGDPDTNATEVFKAYTIETILHEIGHSIGGLTSKYSSNYGGYHYSPGTIMEQYVVASTTKGKCRFAISKTFNTRLDPPAVILK